MASTAVRRARTVLGAGRRRLSGLGTADRSWAQSGEDRIAAFVLEQLGITRPLYLDLGAHHPTHLSNTYLFYRQGARGVLVEANPALHEQLRRKRPKDTCLNLAVAPQDGTVSLHVMDASTLSTTSPRDAQAYRDHGHQVVGTVDVPALSPASLLSLHLPRTPHLVSLDVEGLDLKIVRSWPFETHRPEVFVIETLEYTQDHNERKLTEIGDVMADHGYLAYADTHINTIFVDETAYRR
jgi:FkbM family methyltransferase